MTYGLDDWAEEAIPRQADIDVWGMSHVGRVRRENQDHFLVASLHKLLQVHQTSLPEDHPALLKSGSRGYLFLVADGVGGAPGGREASDLALRSIAHYVTNVVDLCRRGVVEKEDFFLDELRTAVEKSHETVRAEGERAADATGMATTLTMVTVMWPRAFIVHVGDSRVYRLRDGALERLTKDQTMAQAMVDAGAITAERAANSGLSNVLTSAVGGSEVSPEVHVVDCRWQDMMLLCTDGLTRHVSDNEIEAVLLEQPSAEAIAERLVDLALERGGTDNITVVVGRLRART